MPWVRGFTLGTTTRISAIVDTIGLDKLTGRADVIPLGETIRPASWTANAASDLEYGVSFNLKHPEGPPNPCMERKLLLLS